jgi:hypothetical protein
MEPVSVAILRIQAHLRQFADQNRRNSLTLLAVIAQRVKM